MAHIKRECTMSTDILSFMLSHGVYNFATFEVAPDGTFIVSGRGTIRDWLCNPGSADHYWVDAICRNDGTIVSFEIVEDWSFED